MDSLRTTIAVAPTFAGRWWKRLIAKPVGEIITEFTVFVMGVALLYCLDVFVISRTAPLAFSYLIDLVIYLNHHAAEAIEVLR
jgi:hypothetical protein